MPASSPPEPLSAAESALTDGDWGRARDELSRVPESDLDEEARGRLAKLRAVVGPDPIATTIATALGAGYLLILVLLYF